LLGGVLLGLHHRILDLVVGLHLDDHVLQAAIRIFALKDEVGVVAADGARVWVDVLESRNRKTGINSAFTKQIQKVHAFIFHLGSV
jgi:hypothetical protein